MADKPDKRGLPGAGLAKGLATTLKTMTHRSVTAQYPDVKPELPPRTRGVIALLEENCTSCMLCARECPDWCIYIDSHKEVVPATEPGQRDRPGSANRVLVVDRVVARHAAPPPCPVRNLRPGAGSCLVASVVGRRGSARSTRL